jgi:hypothetical protein
MEEGGWIRDRGAPAGSRTIQARPVGEDEDPAEAFGPAGTSLRRDALLDTAQKRLNPGGGRSHRSGVYANHCSDRLNR